MAHLVSLANPSLAAFAIGLPNDITCWQFPNRSRLLQPEKLHLAFITAKARNGDIYVTTEWEKALLNIPAKIARHRAARKAWRRRGL